MKTVNRGLAEGLGPEAFIAGQPCLFRRDCTHALRHVKVTSQASGVRHAAVVASPT